MGVEQRNHIDRVLSLAESVPPPDDPILRSWARCLNDYGLDPARAVPAQIVDNVRLRECQDEVEEFMRVARAGMERLHMRVVDRGYVVLLTNALGITVDFAGDLSNPELKRSGLYLASDWGEGKAGTCGVGTCIVERAPISCHQADHFDSTHLALTCNSAPINDPYGNFLGVLDISALTSPVPRESQHLALQMVALYAQLIEDAAFLNAFRDHGILRLSASRFMVEPAAEMMFAFDRNGAVSGMNGGARRAIADRRLVRREGGGVIAEGRAIGDLFREGMDGVWRLVGSGQGHRMPVHAHSGEIFYASATAPRTARRATPSAGGAGANALRQFGAGDASVTGLADQAARAMNRPLNILILGETGTGKEVLTRAIHASGERSRKPLVAINCAAIPESLIESELFGYAAGSFTGSRHKGKSGLIAEANGGTLFLDEIGDMPLHLQSRLLRVLSANEIMVLGETRATPIDIRLIAASNQDLKQLIAKGRFREDLYYRLCGLTLRLPPLRQRTDRLALIDRVLAEEAEMAGIAARLDDAARALLDRYPWPGNLRELRNVLRAAVSLHRGDGELGPDDLPGEIAQAPEPGDGGSSSRPVAVGRRRQGGTVPSSGDIASALERSRGNVADAALEMGVSRATMYRMIKRYGLSSGRS